MHETHEIADRSGYRLQLANIHLFCGEVLLQVKGDKAVETQYVASLPERLTAAQHLQKAKDYAKDASEFEHLYQSKTRISMTASRNMI